MRTASIALPSPPGISASMALPAEKIRYMNTGRPMVKMTLETFRRIRTVSMRR